MSELDPPVLNGLYERTVITLNEDYRLHAHSENVVCIRIGRLGSPFDTYIFLPELEFISHEKVFHSYIRVTADNWPVQIWDTRTDPRFPNWNKPPHFDTIIYKKITETWKPTYPYLDNGTREPR